MLEIGNADPRDGCIYADIDMIAEPDRPGHVHWGGTP